MLVSHSLKMLYSVISLLFVTLPAFAGPCPADINYIDFGVTDENFQISHGGVLMRVHDKNGNKVMLAATDCLPRFSGDPVVEDEDGKPIPISSDVVVDGSLAYEGMTLLTVTSTPAQFGVDFRIRGDYVAYISRYDVRDIQTIVGDGFTCAVFHENFEGDVSCEVTSLSRENEPAILLCSPMDCNFTASLGDRLSVVAKWNSGGEGLESPIARATWASGVATDTINLLSSNLVR